ncbi:MAG TPA: hypothetical protein VF077_03880 [Nitrospiraceae bacterium]
MTILCQNCRRTPGPDLPGWALPFCEECRQHTCEDYGPGPDDVCRERQAVAQPGARPAVYLGYCTAHWRERHECGRARCRNPKEPWETFCRLHQEQLEAGERRARVREWRTAGVLCPGCRKAPVRPPHRLCAACLVARGVTPLQLTGNKWLTLLHLNARVLPEAEVRVRKRKQIDMAARKAASIQRQEKRRARLARMEAESGPGALAAGILRSLSRPVDEEKAPPPKRVRRRERRVPLPHQVKWKSWFWTGRE